MKDKKLKNRIQQNMEEMIAISNMKEDIIKYHHHKVVLSCTIACLFLFAFAFPNIQNINSTLKEQGLVDRDESNVEKEKAEDKNQSETSISHNVQNEEQDIHNIEIPKEIEKYPEYYGGSYIDDKGYNVILLCRDSEKNRNDISRLLSITKEKTKFKTCKYSYRYLYELQSKISQAMIKHKVPSVSSSSLLDDKNYIEIIMTNDSQEEVVYLKSLDVKGGAIQIKVNESQIHTDKEEIMYKNQ